MGGILGKIIAISDLPYSGNIGCRVGQPRVGAWEKIRTRRAAFFFSER